MADGISEDALRSSDQSSATRAAPDPAAVISAVLKGAAGLGAAATALGFLVVTGRLVAAELPVAGGLEAFGVRTVISSGVRALSVLIIIGVLGLALVPFAIEYGSRKQRTSGGAKSLRRIVVGMALVTAPIGAFLALVALVAAAGIALHGVLVALWVIVPLLALLHVYRTLKHRPEPPWWVRVVAFGLWPAFMLVMAPMAIGIAGALVVVGAAIFTLPSNAQHLDRLLARPPGTAERVVVAVFVLSALVWYAGFVSLTPPTVFNLAVVQLDDGRTVAGAYISRSDGQVVLARCDASPGTVRATPPASLGARERTLLLQRRAFSRNARFVSISSDRIRSVRVTDRSYVFDPGRSRTALGALLAVSDVGPDIGFRVPGVTSTDVMPDRQVCGGHIARARP